MKITGDIFIDAGNFSLNKLSLKCGSKANAIMFVIDLYLGKWNKAIYNFFPNSYFVQPTIDSQIKRERLIDIYINGNYKESHRDKLILSGSQSFSNFYPNFESNLADLDTIINHLFSPLISFRFPKKPLFSLIMSNNLDLIMPFWEEILFKNIYREYPTTLDVDIYDLILFFYKECKDEKTSFDIHSFSNYAQKPQYSIKHYDSESFKRAFILKQNKEKKVWEL